MSVCARRLVPVFLVLLASSQTACNLVPRQSLRQSQLRAFQLHRSGQTLASERDHAHLRAQELAQRNSELESSLATANQRLNNLNAERSALQQRMVSLINQSNPLPESASEKFRELAKKYPQFQFDPTTGVSKFSDDILFDTGSDELKSGATPLLTEFAKIMNDGEAQGLNILVVGHTDDVRIARGPTRAKHPTNWHLSTNRANAVVLALGKAGLKENRMGVAGYSMYQPLVSNKDDQTRRQNRRVEIYVLAPDAVVAGWDPATSRN
ncbi:MAG: OmpA family protein [Planctomycetes bacterium]|nr:OmpA family protein [Planctomycetota bacterium]